MQPASSVYQFGRFHLDTVERRLLRDGEAIPLTPKAFDTLQVLVQHGGHALTKDELMRAVWPDGFIEEVNLAYNISVLRKALSAADGQPGERYIETIPKLGYRFVAPVQASPSHVGEGRGGVRTNLPAQLTRFIGREREIAEVADVVQAKRLLTLTGTGGVGKTRLALEVASRVDDVFADGLWLVEFAPIADAELVTQVAAAALGVTEQPGATLLDLLIARLRSWQALLVFDNCEHLVAACAVLVECLLRACPDLHILATSREPLRIEGEVTWRVPSLTDEEAAQLFVERARTNQPRFEVTARTTPTIGQICRRLDGIPLAIELAAARVNSSSVEQIAERLDRRFDLLTSGSRTALPRHQTLRAAIVWSVDLLSPPEQKLLSQLSVFAGGFTAEAAEAISDQLSTFDLLSKLVDKSLVIAEIKGDVARYRLLETIRQFATEQLRETDGENAARDRHLTYFLKLAESAEIGMRGERLQDWSLRLECELDNLRAALAWSHEAGPIETGLRLVGASWLFWCMQDRAREGLAWVDKLLEVSALALTSAPAKVLYSAAMMAWRTEEWLLMATYTQNALIRSRETEDAIGIALSLTCLGFFAEVELNYQRARDMFEEALGLLRAAQHLWGVGAVKLSLGELLLVQGDFAQGEAFLEESLSLFRVLDWTLLYDALYLMVGAALAQGDLVRAKALAQQRLVLGRENRQMRMYCRALRELGNIAMQEGDYPRAVELLEECIALFRKAGYSESTITHALTDLGFVSYLQGDYETAMQRFNAASAFYQENGNGTSLQYVQLCLGYTSLAQGNPSGAYRHFRECVKLAHKVGYANGIAAGLAGMGWISQAQGNMQLAAKLCGFAAKFIDSLRIYCMPAELAEYERVLAEIRARLDEPTLAAAWAEGQAMSVDQAVEYALAA